MNQSSVILWFRRDITPGIDFNNSIIIIVFETKQLILLWNSFFPMNLSEGVGRAKNVPPGLVIDTDVVSKTHFDYYLSSHEGIQGTSRPTHYFVLWDDNNLSADSIQQLTFSLTHIYARCTRSISFPAPVAYAHLVAYRAQRHIIGYKQSDDSDSGSIAHSSGPADPRRHRGGDDNLVSKINIDSEFKSKMYFC